MARTIACVVLLWAIFYVSLSNSSQDLDSNLIETEIVWQFDDDVEVFDGNATAPTTTPAVKAPKNTVPLINGDFESTNVTGNTTTLADATATTMIPNWLPGGTGVQVIFNAGYQMAPDSSKSVFAIHLNNPASTANGTQGLIATTLATNPTPCNMIAQGCPTDLSTFCLPSKSPQSPVLPLTAGFFIKSGTMPQTPPNKLLG